MSSLSVAPESGSSKLYASSLTMAFGGVRALDDIAFWVPDGGAVGLIGPNGSGKTTLLNVVTGQLRPQSGSIRFNGSEMAGRTPEEFAKAGICRVFQSVQVFPRLTLAENILVAQLGTVGATRASRASTPVLLDRVGLSDHSEHFANELSYGQQRLLEIAMALAANAQLILLDEPTAGLSPMMVERMVVVVRELNRSGTAIVMIEHETDVVFELCDTIWVMNEGRVLARGTSDDIRRDPQVLELYLGAPLPC
jgi:ABC-type branched-subunit amino acid transport system ATPase component